MAKGPYTLNLELLRSSHICLDGKDLCELLYLCEAPETRS